MKRVGNLYEQIISTENLYKAEQNARKGKLKSYGVKIFDQNKDENILSLQNSLLTNSFKTSKYHVFELKTREGKIRTIYRLPYYPDRIVHHAIVNVMEPIWTKTFISQTYSCVKNKGIHGAFYKLRNDLRKNKQQTEYCLKFDIKKYYPSIDHDILKTILSKKIKDQQLLNLLHEIIDSAPGVPIGNYLSQFFANLYLTYFDHFIKENQKQKFYYRYADDIVILSDSKEKLHELFNLSKKYLSENLKLEIKSNHQIFPVKSRGIDFVGYVFFHTHTLMRKSIKKRFAKAVSRRKGEIKNIHSAYYGWSKHCNSKNLLKKLSA